MCVKSTVPRVSSDERSTVPRRFVKVGKFSKTTGVGVGAVVVEDDVDAQPAQQLLDAVRTPDRPPSSSSPPSSSKRSRCSRMAPVTSSSHGARAVEREGLEEFVEGVVEGAHGRRCSRAP
jgi:hypothetical protein